MVFMVAITIFSILTVIGFFVLTEKELTLEAAVTFYKKERWTKSAIKTIVVITIMLCILVLLSSIKWFVMFKLLLCLFTLELILQWLAFVDDLTDNFKFSNHESKQKKENDDVGIFS